MAQNATIYKVELSVADMDRWTCPGLVESD